MRNKAENNILVVCKSRRDFKDFAESHIDICNKEGVKYEYRPTMQRISLHFSKYTTTYIGGIDNEDGKLALDTCGLVFCGIHYNSGLYSGDLINRLSCRLRASWKEN